MNRLIHTLALFALLLVAPLARAELKVLACEPEWGALVKELAGDKVSVYVATTALQDPHRIEARPSLVAAARNAGLVVCTGAELEVGWLPLLIRQSGNSAIQPGKPGHFEAAAYVRMLDVPQRLDRADGDVHAAGNPHIQTDPRNILKVGEALARRMAELDPAGAAAYGAGWKSFAERWTAALARWDKDAAPLRGMPVLVQHKAFPYLEDWLGLRQLDALEPKPGVEPTSGHLAAVAERMKSRPARMVLRPAYQADGPSRWIGERTGIAVVTVPFTVGGTPEARDLFSLFDDTLRRMLAVPR